MKLYIDLLFQLRSYYKSVGDFGMSNTYKKFMNLNHKKYKQILEANEEYFGKKIGLMETEF